MPNEDELKIYQQNRLNEMLNAAQADPSLSPDGTINPHFGSLTPWDQPLAGYPGVGQIPNLQPYPEGNVPLPPPLQGALMPSMPPLVTLEDMIPQLNPQATPPLGPYGGVGGGLAGGGMGGFQ